MNPDNRFEQLESKIDQLLRPDGSPVPRHWSQFRGGSMEDQMRIELNGESYVREADLEAEGWSRVASGPTGFPRAVVVIDRGWIFAGDVEDRDGRVTLHRAVWLFRWERIGFAAVLRDPKQDGVDIRPMPTVVDLPSESEVYRCPVGPDWGL